jgi:trehalose synthase
MLKSVKLPARSFEAYRELTDPAVFDEIQGLAKQLQGKKILQINATDDGGGVAELLHAMVPLYRDLGLDMDWQTIRRARPGFFEITKKIHNGMQGSRNPLSIAEWDYYEAINQEMAQQIDPNAWDLIMVHDPQPAAARQTISDPGRARWAWRCHIDTSQTNPNFASHFVTYLGGYDGAIFTDGRDILEGFNPPKISIMSPAIDPLSPKNRSMKRPDAEKIVAGFGVNLKRPYILQVSRFDPWKDPLGVIEAWRAAKTKIPNLQLVLAGTIAGDDPEGDITLERIHRAAREDKDLYMIVDKANGQAVHALYMLAGVVLQKSLREGFGLTVSEALWAGTPVIGGDVGGIPQQIEPGKNGYLVSTIEETARLIIRLVEDPEKAISMGAHGHETVRQKFLLPRLMRDELKFWNELLGL